MLHAMYTRVSVRIS